MSHEPVLVATDFSEPSRSAFELAWSLCERLQAKLVLVHAWRPTGWLMAVEEAQGWIEAAQESTRARLESWADEARSRKIEVQTRFELGAASGVMIDLSRELAPSLVLVGRSGSAGLAHVLLGSVSERIVRHASSPVLVVPAGARTAVPDRLLVGVDFSTASQQACEIAAALARDLRLERGVLLTHAVPGRDALWLADGVEYDHLRRWPFDRESLEKWARRLRDTTEAATLLVEGAPEIALPLAARTHGCDWIVVGVHGRTALTSLMMGSSATRLLEMSDRPVLTLPVSAVVSETPD